MCVVLKNVPVRKLAVHELPRIFLLCQTAVCGESKYEAYARIMASATRWSARGGVEVIVGLEVARPAA